MARLSLARMTCVLVVICMVVITSAAQTLTTLHSFAGYPTDGSRPGAALIQGRDGYFYGVTADGGANTCLLDYTNNSCGTVFKITKAGTLTILYSFCSQTNCSDGSVPLVLVEATDGNFYGVTYAGANSSCIGGCGTIFRITPRGALTTLYTFCSQTNCADGTKPTSLIQAGNGKLYGTTWEGGANYWGTVFEITPEGKLTTLYSFCSQMSDGLCTDGSRPEGLMQAADGNLYGTTTYGGTVDCYGGGCGTIFKITPRGTLITLYSFCTQANCLDGSSPDASLIQARDGKLYGTTTEGGANNWGTVFQFTPTGRVTTLYSFCSQTYCTDGAAPAANLVQATDGDFYGTASFGGNFADNCGVGCGTIFKITPLGALTTLYTFCSQANCSDGAVPFGALIQSRDGELYGTAYQGGSSSHCLGGCGTVFSLAVPGNDLTGLP
jgi:uncharacterized repeat protein (TIGR03803 family)